MDFQSDRYKDCYGDPPRTSYGPRPESLDPTEALADIAQYHVLETKKTRSAYERRLPNVPLERSLHSTSDHPYLERVNCVLGHARFRLEKCLWNDDLSHILPEKLDYELIKLGADREKNQLCLTSMDSVLWMLKELPDDVLEDVYEADFEPLEYPHLYFVMDEPDTEPFQTALRFLQRQDTLSFAVTALKDPAHPSETLLISVAFATLHYVFLLDLKKIDPTVAVEIIKPILEDAKVHKIVRDGGQCLSHLEKLDITMNNYFDILEIEMGTWREFQQRYKASSCTFRNFPDKNFVSVNRPDPSLPAICQWEHAVLQDVLKDVVYLRLIKSLQLSRLMVRAIRLTEDKLVQLYDYQCDDTGPENAGLREQEAPWSLTASTAADGPNLEDPNSSTTADITDVILDVQDLTVSQKSLVSDDVCPDPDNEWDPYE